MKKIIPLAFIVFCAFGGLFAEEAADQDIDTQIKVVQREIDVYRNRALREERAAERLIFRDYSSYRQHVESQARNEIKVESLTEQLHKLEQQRLDQAKKK
jgi:hypothetical protein